MKQHYLYITECLLNGKKYVGQHITREESIEGMLNDGYFGSGVVLKNAIKKYGRQVFSKEIVAVSRYQSAIDEFEIDFIKENKVLESPDKWYNRAPGGQFKRSEDHSEYMSHVMREVCQRPGYRAAHGWLPSEEMAEKRLFGIRVHLINTLCRVQKIKDMEEKKAIAKAHGFDTYHRYKASVVHIDTEYLRNLNEWQKTPLGRAAMSEIKKGCRPQGFGIHRCAEFKELMDRAGITRAQAAKALGCSISTIKQIRRGYVMVKGVRRDKALRDDYYDIMNTMACD